MNEEGQLKFKAGEVYLLQDVTEKKSKRQNLYMLHVIDEEHVIDKEKKSGNLMRMRWVEFVIAGGKRNNMTVHFSGWLREDNNGFADWLFADWFKKC